MNKLIKKAMAVSSRKKFSIDDNIHTREEYAELIESFTKGNLTAKQVSVALGMIGKDEKMTSGNYQTRLNNFVLTSLKRLIREGKITFNK